MLSYFIPFFQANSFAIACVLTGCSLFLLGAAKVKLTEKNWFISGMEMLMVGGIAAVCAYGIGSFLAGFA